MRPISRLPLRPVSLVNEALSLISFIIPSTMAITPATHHIILLFATTRAVRTRVSLPPRSGGTSMPCYIQLGELGAAKRVGGWVG